MWSSSWFLKIPCMKNSISKTTNGSKSPTNCPRNLDLLSSGSDQAPVGCLQKLDFDLKDRRGVESTLAFFWLDLGPFFCLSFFWLLEFAWIFYIAFFLWFEAGGCYWEYEVWYTASKFDRGEWSMPSRTQVPDQASLRRTGWWWNAPPCASARNLFGKLFERWNWEEMCVLGTKITVKLLATDTCDMSLPCHTYPQGGWKTVTGKSSKQRIHQLAKEPNREGSFRFVLCLGASWCNFLDDFQRLKKTKDWYDDEMFFLFFWGGWVLANPSQKRDGKKL